MGSAHAKDRSGFLWVEAGEDVVGPVARVALMGPVDRAYTYAIPPKLAGAIAPGQRVGVPVGRRGKVSPAFCIGIDEQPWTSTLRPIDSLIDDQSYLTGEMLELGKWMSRYYACPLGRTLKSLVPESVRQRSGYTKVVRVSLAQSVEAIRESQKRIGPKQRAVIDRLAMEDGAMVMDRLLSESGASRATVRAMADRGWVHLEQEQVALPAPDFDRPAEEPTFEPDADQLAALERINEVSASGVFRVLLLFGVAGSGKTEVYVRAMREVLARGRQVVMLVPEIALTTQLVHRLSARFTDVAVVHSGLTGVQRSLTWSAIRSGEKRVVIGTRSAVFAPCPNLGLIVVDEEQESSYKNLQAPRFHVRDVAILRARRLSIPVVLGSATPSMETWHNCERLEHFERIELPRRVCDLPMPHVTVVDVNDEFHAKTGVPLLSRLMIRKLGEVLDRGEQAILLLNRRGYSSVLMCPLCRQRVSCPDCNVNMVYHAAREEIRCHYCSRRAFAPKECPDSSCAGRLVRSGSGTQRVEEQLANRFPSARIVRVDSDTMNHPRAYRAVVEEFEARKIDCLIGTQMIAKGLDFPFVSFVGVLGAETSASMPDFRASERLFQLVTQVAGRAGRSGVGGEVVVQTQSPDSIALQCAVRHDFLAFARAELELRRRTRMPPYSRLTRLIVAHASEPDAQRVAAELAESARSSIAELALPESDVLGPMPCVLARLRGQYRYELLLRCGSPDTMGRLLEHLRAERWLGPRSGASVLVDVDPLSLV